MSLMGGVPACNDVTHVRATCVMSSPCINYMGDVTLHQNDRYICFYCQHHVQDNTYCTHSCFLVTCITCILNSIDIIFNKN